MRAYSKRQFAMSDFDRTGYKFNETYQRNKRGNNKLIAVRRAE